MQALGRGAESCKLQVAGCKPCRRPAGLTKCTDAKRAARQTLNRTERPLNRRIEDGKIFLSASGQRFQQFAKRKCKRLKRFSRARAAFTLIELMVVIALIGILSAMIIPEMRGTLDDALLRSTSRRFVNACNLAYSRAVSLNQIHRLRLDRTDARLVLETRVPGPARSGEYAPVKDLAGSEWELDSRVSVTLRGRPGESSSSPDEQEPPDSSEEFKSGDSSETIAFYPDGTAERKEILLRDREGFRLALRINPITARVHIIDLPRE